MYDIYIPQLQTKRIEIYEEWQEVWQELCTELEEQNNKVEFIEISLLRHAIISNDESAFLLEAFDEKWLFDGLLYKKKVSLLSLTSIICSFREDICLESRKYIGKIQFHYGEKAFLQYLPDFEVSIVELLKDRIDTWLQFSDDYPLFSPNLQLSLGGYRFFQNILHGKEK
jgi:hypothetical protein